MDGSRNISLAVTAASTFVVAGILTCMPVQDASATALQPAKGTTRHIIDLSHKKPAAPTQQRPQQNLGPSNHRPVNAGPGRMVDMSRSQSSHAPTGYIVQDNGTDEAKLGPHNQPQNVELRQGEKGAELVNYGDKSSVPDGTGVYLKGQVGDKQIDGVYRKEHGQLVPVHNVKYSIPRETQHYSPTPAPGPIFGRHDRAVPPHQLNNKPSEKHDEGQPKEYKKPENQKNVKNYMDNYFKQHPEKKEIPVECTCQEKKPPEKTPPEKKKPPEEHKPPEMHHYVIKKKEDHCDVFEMHGNKEEKVGVITKTGEFISTSAGGWLAGNAIYGAIGAAAQSGNYQFFDLSHITYSPPPAPTTEAPGQPGVGNTRIGAAIQNLAKNCIDWCAETKFINTWLTHISANNDITTEQTRTQTLIQFHDSGVKLCYDKADIKIRVSGLKPDQLAQIGSDFDQCVKTVDQNTKALATSTGDKDNPVLAILSAGGGTGGGSNNGGPNNPPTGGAVNTNLIYGGIAGLSLAALALGLIGRRRGWFRRSGPTTDGAPDPTGSDPGRIRRGAAAAATLPGRVLGSLRYLVRRPSTAMSQVATDIVAMASATPLVADASAIAVSFARAADASAYNVQFVQPTSATNANDTAQANDAKQKEGADLIAQKQAEEDHLIAMMKADADQRDAETAARIQQAAEQAAMKRDASIKADMDRDANMLFGQDATLAIADAADQSAANIVREDRRLRRADLAAQRAEQKRINQTTAPARSANEVADQIIGLRTQLADALEAAKGNKRAKPVMTIRRQIDTLIKEAQAGSQFRRAETLRQTAAARAEVITRQALPEGVASLESYRQRRQDPAVAVVKDTPAQRLRA